MNENDRGILIQRGLMPPTKRIDSLLDSGATEPAKRQFCRKCQRSSVPAVTLTFEQGQRRLHWCAEHIEDAERYRPGSDQAIKPTAQTHNFWPYAGGVCRLLVERPDGRREECGEPVKSPVHDPVAYLAYAAEPAPARPTTPRGLYVQMGAVEPASARPAPPKLTEPQARMLAEYVYAVRNGRWSTGAKQSSELRSRLHDMGLLVGRDSWPYYEVSDLGAAALERHETARAARRG